MATDNEEYYKQQIEKLENEKEEQKQNKKFHSPDIETTTSEIRATIREIKQERSKIKPAATEKARAISNFKSKKAITVLKLKNRLITEMTDKDTGEIVEIPPLPATVITDIAEGICWYELLQREESEAMYKAIIATLESIRAELNGLQSISRHLE
ncbi:MAG: hypothetical protein K9J21_12575 [Bacteroidales bacterium]|nr:hypothetical protein [Bacteroidales bacterium]